MKQAAIFGRLLAGWNLRLLLVLCFRAFGTLQLKATASRRRTITRTMTEVSHRPAWEIDQTLKRLKGRPVRLLVDAFAPVDRSGKAIERLTTSRQLVLPDNTPADGLPLYFEGRLQAFERRIGVVQVRLGALKLKEVGAEGIQCFRGGTAVILRGPALVVLAFPFHVERIPVDPANYWSDVRYPTAQFQFDFDR